MAKGERIFKERGVTVNDLFVGNFVESHSAVFRGQGCRNNLSASQCAKRLISAIRSIVLRQMYQKIAGNS
jgi:hypothetical protein